MSSTSTSAVFSRISAAQLAVVAGLADDLDVGASDSVSRMPRRISAWSSQRRP
jgi:hypothetical protein